MNSNLDPENKSSPRLAAAWRWLPLLIIVVAACAYYGSYLQYWFNPHDESGFACLIAQRLMNGERPWIDVELGYNIGWFYPLIAIFKVTGVNYLVARGWFFVLATITALLGFGIVSRVSGSRLLGLGAGLLLVLLPGSQFKNYIQLAQAANTACLVYLAFVDPTSRRKWLGTAAIGGVVLGLTYLVRVELGFFFTAIWLMFLLVFLLDRRLPALRRFAATAGGIVALAGGVVVAQTPAYLDLRGRGLETYYWSEYSGWLDFLRAAVAQQLGYDRRAHSPPPAIPLEGKHAAKAAKIAAAQDATAQPATTPSPDAVPAATPAPEAAPAESEAKSTTPQRTEAADRTTLPRKPFSAIWSGAWRDGLLAFLTYAPFVTFGFFVVAGLIEFMRSQATGKFTTTAPGFLWLLLAGASLTTFPQFFFFRPDRPHLSEFMTGHIVAIIACLWLLWPRGASRPPALRYMAWAVAFFFAVQLAAFTTFALQHPSSGTIAARFGRKNWLHGENGVHVREFKRQATAFKGIHDTVLKAAGPDDYVICFPYMPGYNVMTNRRTYLRNVYVDNATRSANWSAETIRDFEEKKPAVVIIDNRAINATEGSRFSNWAPQVHDYLKTHYTLAGNFESVEVEVFTRPASPVP